MAKFLSLFFISIFAASAFFARDYLNGTAQFALDFILSKFGWLYLLVNFSALCYCLYLIFSRHSSQILGKEGDKPTYPFFSWLAMLFAAGMGIGLVFYGVAEPLAHYHNPPLDTVDPKSPAGGILALRYSFFHWGLHPWSIYGLMGLCIAYYRFREGRTYLISDLFRSAGINRVRITVIDAVSITGVAFGVATSLGLGSLQIQSGLGFLFGFPKGVEAALCLIAFTTILYLTSALTGLDRGIKILSNFNIILAGFLVFAVFFLGPTNFIIEIFSSSVGAYLQNLPTMSFRMTPFSESNWLREWTLFYWAWWISWAPFVATFIARISKGRTIREFLLGVLIAPTLLSAFWFSVLGGTAIYQETFGGLPIVELAGDDITKSLFITLNSLPFGRVLAFVSVILVFVFFITSADSATFVLGIFASNGDPDPKLSTKLIWGIAVALIASGLLVLDGLAALRTVAIIISLPLAVLLIVLIRIFQKDLSRSE